MDWLEITYTILLLFQHFLDSFVFVFVVLSCRFSDRPAAARFAVKRNSFVTGHQSSIHRSWLQISLTGIYGSNHPLFGLFEGRPRESNRLELQTCSLLGIEVFSILVALFCSRLSAGSFGSFSDSLRLHHEDPRVQGGGGLLRVGGQDEAVH